jgi:hypothetical protein
MKNGEATEYAVDLVLVVVTLEFPGTCLHM